MVLHKCTFLLQHIAFPPEEVAFEMQPITTTTERTGEESSARVVCSWAVWEYSIEIPRRVDCFSSESVFEMAKLLGLFEKIFDMISQPKSTTDLKPSSVYKYYFHTTNAFICRSQEDNRKIDYAFARSQQVTYIHPSVIVL